MGSGPSPSFLRQARVPATGQVGTCAGLLHHIFAFNTMLDVLYLLHLIVFEHACWCGTYTNLFAWVGCLDSAGFAAYSPDSRFHHLQFGSIPVLDAVLPAACFLLAYLDPGTSGLRAGGGAVHRATSSPRVYLLPAACRLVSPYIY